MEFKGTKGEWEKLGLSVFCNESGKYVCKIYTDKTNEIDEANAKLIAAAPDLLDALKGLLSQIENEHVSEFMTEFTNNAEEAIEKALR